MLLPWGPTDQKLCYSAHYRGPTHFGTFMSKELEDRDGEGHSQLTNIGDVQLLTMYGLWW
jgi:hypothetical protein